MIFSALFDKETVTGIFKTFVSVFWPYEVYLIVLRKIYHICPPNIGPLVCGRDICDANTLKICSHNRLNCSGLNTKPNILNIWVIFSS